MSLREDPGPTPGNDPGYALTYFRNYPKPLYANNPDVPRDLGKALDEIDKDVEEVARGLGTGTNWKGEVPTEDDLPDDPALGDLWLVTDTNHLWIYTESGWVDLGEAGKEGPEGPQGPIGPVGPKGDKGDTGAEGAKGKDGEQGPKGNPGDTGPRGPEGPQGPKGDDGADGAKGSKGDEGPQGPKGEQGPQGERGPQGPPGPGGGGGECATNYDELKDCAPTGGGSGDGGGGCFENYGDQKNCSPSDQDHLVLLDGAARPTKYVGKGRPDVDMPDTGNVGDTYICTDPYTYGAGGNYGACEWRFNGTDWVCIEGAAPAQSITGGDGVSACTVRRFGEYMRVHYYSNNVKAGQIFAFAEGYRSAHGETLPVVKRMTGTCVEFFIAPNGEVSLQMSDESLIGPYSEYQGSVLIRATSKWPTSSPNATSALFAELKAKIEEIENDPEKAEQLAQLRQELEALRSNDA